MLVYGDYEVVDSDGGDSLGDGAFVHIWRLGDDSEWRIDRELWFAEVIAVRVTCVDRSLDALAAT